MTTRTHGLLVTLVVLSLLGREAVAAEPPETAPPSTAERAIGWIEETASSLPGAIRQGAWEISYLFGFNRTKAVRPVVVDTIDELPAAPPVVLAQAANVVPGPALPPVVPPRSAGSLPTMPGAVAPEEAGVDRGLIANLVFDRGSRRPDGSYFVPKSLQRLFEVRVEAVTEADVAPVLRMTGRIVPDPRAHGTVQAGLVGRLVPPEAGFPLLGAHVTKGDLLGYVAPAVGVVDRTQVRRDIARLTTDIRVETENLEILKQFSFVPFRDGKIYQAETRIRGMRAERDALLPLLRTLETLVAPIDGVISEAHALPGRLVQPGDMVYDVVSPSEFWVEAMAPTPAIAAAAGQPMAATATTPEGEVLTLAYVGSGLALQQQSTPMMFRIDTPPPGLRLGRPVTIGVQGSGGRLHGIPVSRDSVTAGTDGLPEVWEQLEAEVFQPHVVRTRELDGGTVLVTDGLKAGVKLVRHGIRLMAQLQ